MSNQTWRDEVLDYIINTRFATLAYVRKDGVPILRVMGSFATSGLDLYFSSQKSAAKVDEIANHNQVSFYFERDNQNLNSWKSVLLIGEANQVTDEAQLKQAVELLGNRNPRFKERITNEGLSNTAIFKITTREVEYLDRSCGPGVKKYTV